MAGVAGLAAGLAIEGRLVSDDLDRLAWLGRHHPAAILEDGQDLAFGFLSVIAQKFRAADFIQHREPLRFAGGFAEPDQEARASAFCFCIAAEKPSVSTLMPRARRDSSVRSSGKP